jgi:DNA-directed RNA polymerase subunit RPC12/RpoP
MDEIMSTSSDKCPRCGGPKERGVHDCAACSRKIAENVGKQGKRTEDGGAH